MAQLMKFNYKQIEKTVSQKQGEHTVWHFLLLCLSLKHNIIGNEKDRKLASPASNAEQLPKHSPVRAKEVHSIVVRITELLQLKLLQQIQLTTALNKSFHLVVVGLRQFHSTFSGRLDQLVQTTLQQCSRFGGHLCAIEHLIDGSQCQTTGLVGRGHKVDKVVVGNIVCNLHRLGEVHATAAATGEVVAVNVDAADAAAVFAAVVIKKFAGNPPKDGGQLLRLNTLKLQHKTLDETEERRGCHCRV